jgi:hypothetical protein
VSDGSTLRQIDEYSVEIKVGADKSNFEYTIKNFVNPYSSVTQTYVRVNLYPKCGSTPVACVDDDKDSGCKSSNRFVFSIPASSNFNPPVTEILDAEGGTTKSFVGSTNGYVTFSFQHNEFIPKYGGSFQFQVPAWFLNSDQYVLEV